MSNARTAKEAIIEGLFEDADKLIDKIDRTDKSIKESTFALAKQIDQIKGAADAATQAAAAESISVLSEKVAAIADAIAKNSANAERLKAFRMAVAAAVAGVVVIGGGGFWAGMKYGAADYAFEVASLEAALAKKDLEVKKEKTDLAAAAGWIGSKEGKLARSFASANGVASMEKIIACSQPGWEIQKKNGQRWCYPFSEKPGVFSDSPGGAYGWRLP